MNKGTLQTITRHLKGIVAALDNNAEFEYIGVKVSEMSYSKLKRGYNRVEKDRAITLTVEQQQFVLENLYEEMKKRDSRLE